METEAYYKILVKENIIGKKTSIFFRINNINFIINFYCITPYYISRKFIGINILKNLIKESTYISLKGCYSIDYFNNSINITENKTLVEKIIKLKEVLIEFNYSLNENLRYQTKEILYYKIWPK